MPLQPAQAPIIAQASAHTRTRFLEFFAAAIRNPNTRRAYARASSNFLAWCFVHGVRDLAAISPMHVAGWIEELGTTLSSPPSSSAWRRCDTCSTGW